MPAPVADHDPQQVEWTFGINDPTIPTDWTPPLTTPRVAVDHESIGFTAAMVKPDTTGRITGLAAQTGSSQTGLAPQGENSVPLRLGSYEMGVIAHLAEKYQTPVQFGSDNAWAWKIGPAESDVSLVDRSLWASYDKRDGNPQVVGPMKIQACNFEFNAGEEAMMTYAPLAREWNYFSPPGSIVGTAEFPLQIFGWLNAANRALVDHNVTIEVIGFATPVLTLAAYFGGASAGGVTFTLEAGLNSEGRPNVAEVVDSNGSVEGDHMGRAGNPVYVYAPSIIGHVIADEYTYENPIQPAAVVKPVNSSIPVANICIEIDDVPQIGVDSMNLNIVTTWQFLPGGVWGLFPRGWNRLGVSVVGGTLSKKNDSYAIEGKMRDDANFAIKVFGRTDVLVDPGGLEGAKESFRFNIPKCQFPDGTAFKAFADGSADDGLEVPFTGVSSSALSGAAWEFEANSPVASVA